ncbi:hypothetical protein PAHAL_2G301900 [Panicum hallii]|uniref:Uncharacterized protein n=1 Tax=Panicum hallii TaxID=206008 RepID=A0A2S3H0I7_9POAL|nr:uncharacterized protein LOC112880537 [Panicum hallii]PAN12928.1 hypothetical protein PAHAL_2G301900 [Panicum hallii]
MRRAGVLLALLLSLSALSATAAEAHKERLGENAVLLTGRKWLRGRKIMAALGHGDAAKNDEVVEGEGAKSTGANQEADAPAAEAVHDSGNRSKGHAMFPAPRQGDTAAEAPEVLGMDYNFKLDARHHRPINNDAPLDDLAKKP